MRGPALRATIRRVIRLIGIVVSIGIADSLNPTTIAPALYLASHSCPRRARLELLRFTAGVFIVYLFGGVAIALGPGQLLLALAPEISPSARDGVEIAVGAAMLLASVLLWVKRRRLRAAEPRLPRMGGSSSALLGATIMAVELPTAFPYFAAIAAIVGSGRGPLNQVMLLLLFNFCFVAPLLAIVATLWLAGDHASQILSRWRTFLERHWPAVLSGLALLAGATVTFLGLTGLGLHSHGRFRHISRALRRLLHLSTKS
jgi:cytochrome c biogenesis protein CcdA